MKMKIDYPVWLGLFICAVFPLILRAVALRFSAETYYFTGQQGTYDICNYAKAVALAFAALGVGIIVFIERLTDGKSMMLDRITKIAVAMAVLVLVSWGMSKHSSEAFHGGYDHFEGVFVWLAYLIVFVLAYTGHLKRARIQKILPVAALSSLVVAVTGIVQFWSIQIFDLQLFRMMIMPSAYWNTPTPIFGEFGTVACSFLGNPNYAGTYAILVIPLFLFAYSVEKKHVLQTIYGSTAVLNTVFLVFSRSEAGFMGFMVGLGALVALSVIHRKWDMLIAVCVLQGVFWGCFVGSGVLTSVELPAAILGAVFCVSGVVCFCLLNPRVSVSVKVGACVAILIVGGIGILKITKYESERWQSRTDWRHVEVSKLQIGFDVMKNGKEEKILTVSKVNEGFEVRSGDFLTVVKASDLAQKTIQLDIVKTLGSVLKIYSAQGGVTAFEMESPKLRFGYFENRFEVFNRGGFPIKTDEVIPSIKFFKDETLGSQRAYIWNRTLAMIPEHLLTGSGPDTFVLEFPQDDVLGKINAYGNGNMVVTKPHNMYLQLAVNMGVPFLLLFIALNLIALNRTLVSVTPESGLWVLGVAILGYLVAGFFNDSVVANATIFWYILGATLGWSEDKDAA